MGVVGHESGMTLKILTWKKQDGVTINGDGEG